MRKIAIVGSSPTSRDLAPYDDPSWEIWSLNDMILLGRRIDRHFEMHDPRVFLTTSESEFGVKAEVEWLKENDTIPVYMREVLDWVPRSVEYPLEAIIKEFGRYLTSTASYMLALAIYEGVDEIGIWGTDMAHGTEYATQLPSCEYFIGVARGRGIPVHIAEGSTLLANSHLYGEYDPFVADAKSRIAVLTQEKEDQRKAQAAATINQAKIDGALEMLHYFTTTYG